MDDFFENGPALKRVKHNDTPANQTAEKRCSTPGRTDDLTSHSSDDADADNDSTQGSKSKSNSKLFNAPKRPKTAYMIFLDKSKAPFFEKNPKATFNEYQKYAGQRWRSFTQDEKMSEIESRKEFFKEIQELHATFGLTKEQSRQAVTPQTGREPACSTPKTAFPLYVQAMKGRMQEQNPGMSYNELQKELSKEWRAMKSGDKQVWINLAKEGQKTHRPTGSAGKTSAGQKKGVMLPRGPRSAYTLFYQCARKQLSEERPELSFREFPTICSQIWRNMPDEERALWQADSAQDRERYEKELLDMASQQTIYNPHESNSKSTLTSIQAGGGESGGNKKKQKQQQRPPSPSRPLNGASAASARSSISRHDGSFLFDDDHQSDAYVRLRSCSSSWGDMGADFWNHSSSRLLEGVAIPPLSDSPSTTTKRKVRVLKEESSGREEYPPLDDSEKEYHLHTDLTGQDLPPLLLPFRTKGDDVAFDVHFDDLAAVGPHMFDLGEDSHMNGDQLLSFPVNTSCGSHPSSTKSNDTLQQFLGFSHDDIFGQDTSSLFN